MHHLNYKKEIYVYVYFISSFLCVLSSLEA